ncbi:hypothetical protein [Cryptosporidium parvum Iowa II]|uniref:Uncharacterized protein n=2 Tax=Cryptosporidium parvum TaxID=5807 RepID=Q5CVV7_CRYPI|nr:hypothetical protein [Cryptosporidium parvum Iowa II]EAK89449.1 hypothetical protein cgd8_2620 [Cryptosporidium parvum Iowa II]QOY40019.1 Uncharacterized protein CPATCC_0002740 [Cryptosporidium parvum]WKS79516.1 hypothetical protein CPCDC_8g2620 [Cryptosporidium sp. 43IA8]WRK34017.1 Uncharacterized protein cpbgf_8002620 [Cryptosporidium parvum]|eukprot:QOY40019.1 hypothetical protein CPATCC_004088 [Cryptosporidium parvum]
MLRLEETKFSGSSLGSGSFSDSSLVRPYSRYSQSGAYIITLKEYKELSSEHYLEIYDSLSGHSHIKTFKNGIKSVRNINLVRNRNINQDKSFNEEINYGDLIFIEDKDGGVEIYSLCDGKSFLFNCMVLVGRLIKKVSAFKVNNSILIVIVMTDSDIFLISNFQYSSFEAICQINESQNSMENLNINETDFKLRYYKQVTPDFDGELGECCVTSLGRFYFSCFNEIFKLEFPQGDKERISDFQLKQVYILDIDEERSNKSLNLSINNLVSYETLINGDQFELIYIIQDDEKHFGLKNLSLLKVKIDSRACEYHFDKLSTIGNAGKLCHILSCKVFENGQLGVIWESNNQIYVNVFNNFFNGFQKSFLNYSSHLSDDSYGKKFSNKTNYRDLASLLYGDAPLIYIDESEFSSSSQRTNEILKIHSRIFSDSLKVRDIEKEEQLIKNIIDSIFLSEKSCSKTVLKYKKESNLASDNFILRNMDQFIFFGLPFFFPPVLGIKPNENITNLPDDWYSCMSFTIKTFACDSNGNQNIVKVNYTCWYEGVFNYLSNNLHSILKTPQMHLHVLKRLTLLPPESKSTKPTSLWIALNSIKTIQDFQNLDRNDINLFFNIIDIYTKNGIEKRLFEFAKNNLTNFSNVLYSWSINQSVEVISILRKAIMKSKSDSYHKIFRFKENNEHLEILLGLSFLGNDVKLLSAFVSSNIRPMKSALNIMEFVLDSGNPNIEADESLTGFRRLIYSLIEWKNVFGLVCSFKSFIESDNFQGERESVHFPTSGLIKLAIENINELSVFDQEILEDILNKNNFTWENLLTLSLLLEIFIASKFQQRNLLFNLCGNQLNLVSKLDVFLASLFPVQSYCHIFSRLASNSINQHDLIDFY